MADKPEVFVIGQCNFENLLSAGILGATATDPRLLDNARLLMIERRLLRIEMALRRAGIEVENIDLPT